LNYGKWVISENLQPLAGYTNWAAGEIINDTALGCAYMSAIDGRWHTHDCTTTHPYICQGELPMWTRFHYHTCEDNSYVAKAIIILNG